MKVPATRRTTQASSGSGKAGLKQAPPVFQGCDLEVGKIMYPKITTLMSKKLKIMYIFQKIMY